MLKLEDTPANRRLMRSAILRVVERLQLAASTEETTAYEMLYDARGILESGYGLIMDTVVDELTERVKNP